MSDTICGLKHFHSPHSWGDLNWCPGDPDQTADDDARLTAHAWGFFENGYARIPNGVAVSAEAPHAAFTRIRANIEHHGGTCTDVRVTRSLDGLFVGATWETPERPDKTAARMWHMVVQESDSWADPTRVIPPASSDPH